MTRTKTNLEKRIGQMVTGAPPQRSLTKVTNIITDTVTIPVVIRKFPIMWGIPCDELSYTRFWTEFERNASRMPWDDFASSEGTYINTARNAIHNAFLDSKLSHLMMLDSDILFPPNIAEKLMAHNKPMVGGWYRDKKAPDRHPVIFDYLYDDAKGVSIWNHRTEPGKGLEKVDGMGAGCWLMRHDVADALGKNPYETDSEDLVLSRKLTKLGIPLFVDWSLNCAHLGVKVT
jgi:hypothetical protein